MPIGKRTNQGEAGSAEGFRGVRTPRHQTHYYRLGFRGLGEVETNREGTQEMYDRVYFPARLQVKGSGKFGRRRRGVPSVGLDHWGGNK